MKNIIVSILSIVFIMILINITFQDKTIEFNESLIEIQINSEYQTISNIKNVEKGKQVEVYDTLDTSSLGAYKISYSIDNKEYSYLVSVVDKLAPEVVTISTKLVVGEQISPSQLIQSVQDDTETTVAFLEDYSFNDVGNKIIKLLVEDSSGNQTKCSVEIEVIEDKMAPYIVDMQPLYSSIYEPIDYLEGVEIKDDYDNNPTIEVSYENVNINEVGTYQIDYLLKDIFGNETTITREVVITSDKIIYLTFDDGPSLNTSKILEILEEYNVKATFFVCGIASNYYYLIEEAHLAGHAIGVHTYSHDYSLIYSSVDAFFKDINTMNEIIYNYTGTYSTLLRFPGGSSNTISANYCLNIMGELTTMVEDQGYTYYDWNSSNGDAEAFLVDVEDLIEEGTQSNAQNINLLMHDSATKTTTVEALPFIIEYYLERGYSFETLDEDSYTVHHNVQN